MKIHGEVNTNRFGNDYFIVKFLKEENMLTALQKGPWFINRATKMAPQLCCIGSYGKLYGNLDPAIGTTDGVLQPLYTIKN